MVDRNPYFMQALSPLEIIEQKVCCIKGEITHNIESVPKVSHLWGKIDFL